jgi:hypothetical protein
MGLHGVIFFKKSGKIFAGKPCVFGANSAKVPILKNRFFAGIRQNPHRIAPMADVVLRQAEPF